MPQKKKPEIESKTHIHKYELTNLGTDLKPFKVYKCMKVGCAHYMPNKKLVINMKSICHRCGEDFIITKDIIRANTVKPKCPDCRGKRIGAREDRALERLIDTMKF